MWIVKPAAKSRGRGIECFTDLHKLLSYTDSKQPQAVSQWVVHKYMEVMFRSVCNSGGGRRKGRRTVLEYFAVVQPLR